MAASLLVRSIRRADARRRRQKIPPLLTLCQSLIAAVFPVPDFVFANEPRTTRGRPC